MDLKKAYYYIICLAALFIFAWGVVDLVSAASGLMMNRSSSAQMEQEIPSEKTGEPFLEIYYQKKMLYDRLWDSVARIAIAGAIFAYSRIKVSRLEK